MPKYIDADKVMEEIASMGGHNLCEWSTLGVKALIDRQPTADVAPRAEVEYWKEQCFNACMNNGCSDETIVRAAVAREIFEELRRYIINHCYLADDDVDAIWKHIDKLKKIYTDAEPPKGD